MTRTIRTTTFSMLIALVLLAVTVTSAFAAPPQNLHIEVDEVIGTSGETFFASGPAVGSGLVCATGTVDDLSIVVSSPGGATTILHVLKRFYCADSSGTFDVRMVVHLDNTTHETTARWRIAGGTGAYTSLRGNGQLAGTPIVPGTSIHDVYDGRVN